MNLLNKTSQALLSDFKAGNIDLTKQNALQIRNAIMDLHKGLEKLELDFEGMKSTFNRPLTPDETIDTFRNYINRLAEGKERDKIRIILK